MTAAPGRAPGRALEHGWGGEPPKRFTISVADAVLSDLQRRLEATRWPDEISGSRWAYGTDLQYLKNLVDYWRKGYAWRDQEAALIGSIISRSRSTTSIFTSFTNPGKAARRFHFC